ncbi:MAG: hypothetical protein ABIE74_09720 [Pseudomonadota bacterium]
MSNRLSYNALLKIIVVIICLFASFNLNAQEAQGKPLSGLNTQGFEEITGDKMIWRNNPFVQPVDDVAVNELALTGIVYSKDDSAALVNNQVVREGESIGFNEVVEIEENRVIFKNENGFFSVPLRNVEQSGK